ncbi:MAG TPA: DUF2868 domain-containing protein [Polyangiales bacterium]|nr:DUF2868 domain-containing protein [Polyangiales bacterium]
MHAAVLRKVLLIRSIDEGDKAFEVLSLAERTDATQRAAQEAPAIAQGLAGATLPVAAERLLEHRAEMLFEKLRVRSPVVVRVMELAAGVSWLGLLVLAVAFACGLGMSALDGSQRIDLLAFPLLGLLAWNFVVYVVLIVASLRPRRPRPPVALWLSSSYARWIRSRADALLRQASRFNVPLAEALQRFAVDWAQVAHPLLLLRAQRLFHAGAALLALGLVTGMYVRGMVLRYAAGWESTFLDADQVHALTKALYGPASALSGIALPSSAELQALRWGEAGSGAPAASWIHLIALSAVLYIVLPRLIAVVLTSAALWRAERKPALPASFVAYARSLLLETGRVTGLRARVVTYAFDPSRDALAGLGVLLTDALGGQVEVEIGERVAYGEEDAFATRVREQQLPAADCQVLLMSLSATPESENHGVMIDAMSRARGRRGPGFVLVVDESAYAARMGGDPALSGRVAERARSWRDFASSRGQAPCIADLSRLRAGDTPDPAARRDVREALQRSASA